ncbi:hypothetical protein QAD02_011841 [Eretmocerus hayati]|uniref:Uncharacterized protein n=1 Tax=Eretmocerus hayati TaxID=131215 RepID=A0ACC2NXX8_9HYME|nr:hypothetical protein QAD02_011841 [Eretmocerus hayati]
MCISVFPTHSGYRVFVFRQAVDVFVDGVYDAATVGFLQESMNIGPVWPPSPAPDIHDCAWAFLHRGASAFFSAKVLGHGPVEVIRACRPVEVPPCVVHVVGATKPGFCLLTGLDVQEAVVFLLFLPQDRRFPAS